MNFRTESFDFPQNEQRRCLSCDMAIRGAWGATATGWVVPGAIIPPRRGERQTRTAGRESGVAEEASRGNSATPDPRPPTPLLRGHRRLLRRLDDVAAVRDDVVD